MAYQKRKTDKTKERKWQGILKKQLNSGIPVSKYCQKRKIKPAQFYWWKKKLKQSVNASRKT